MLEGARGLIASAIECATVAIFFISNWFPFGQCEAAQCEFSAWTCLKQAAYPMTRNDSFGQEMSVFD